MSDDLVKRLLAWAKDIREGSTAIWAMDLDLKEAAARIQDLESRLEAMTLQHEAALEAVAKAREAALREILGACDTPITLPNLNTLQGLDAGDGWLAGARHIAQYNRDAILALINKGPADGPECFTIPGAEQALIDGLDAKIAKLDALCADTADTMERALKDKAFREDWAWVFEDTHTALTERNNPPDATIEPHPAINKGDSNGLV